MSDIILLLILTITFSLIFEFTNGFHDAANVVSTVIATKVLAPLVAIVLAATFNLIGGTQISKVAETIISGIIPSASATQTIVLSALFGAIFWNLFTWYFGIPSSSTYALIGGVVGAGISALGPNLIFWSSIVKKVLIPMSISPVIGFFLSLLLMRLLYRMISKKLSNKQFSIFGKLQVLSASLVTLSHGFNDAQKTMAIITLSLFSASKIPSLQIPFWVVIMCAFVMALGTYFGGFRIIQTVGYKITKLEPAEGFCAETSASLLIFIASFLGFPLSSTHLIVGSVAGVGCAKRFSNTSWKTMKTMTYAWLFTLPGSALAAMLMCEVLKLVF